MIVGRELAKLEKEFPQLLIKKIDILTHPVQAMQEGVKMIPTLIAGEKRLSGFLLSSQELRSFVTNMLKE
jgi:hypothetical protein